MPETPEPEQPPVKPNFHFHPDALQYETQPEPEPKEEYDNSEDMKALLDRHFKRMKEIEEKEIATVGALSKAQAELIFRNGIASVPKTAQEILEEAKETVEDMLENIG